MTLSHGRAAAVHDCRRSSGAHWQARTRTPSLRLTPRPSRTRTLALHGCQQVSRVSDDDRSATIVMMTRRAQLPELPSHCHWQARFDARMRPQNVPTGESSSRPGYESLHASVTSPDRAGPLPEQPTPSRSPDARVVRTVRTGQGLGLSEPKAGPPGDLDWLSLTAITAAARRRAWVGTFAP